MKGAFARVLAAPVQRLPSPHFALDDVLRTDEIDQILAHWPDSDLFPEEGVGSGYRVLRFEDPTNWAALSRAQREFWTEFMHGLCLQIVQGTFTVYAPLIHARFGPALKSVDLATVSLTEFEHDGTRAGVHVHNDEATWLFTNLIHIEDGGEGERGNALYGFPDGAEPGALERNLRRAAAVLPGLAPEELEVKRRVPFKPGRMFSFFESPLSYHGSEPVERGKGYGKRRMIRIHARAPEALSHLLYGVSAKDYRRLRQVQDPSPLLLSWMKADVERYLSAPHLELRPDLLRFIGSVEFLGVHGARTPKYRIDEPR